MFAGFLSSWALSLLLRRGRSVLMPPPWMLVTFVAFITVMGFDGVNATLFDLNTAGVPVPYLYAPRLDARLATGLLTGIAMAGIILPFVNFAIWREKKAEPIFGDLLDLATLLIWNVIIYLAVVSGSGLLLIPVSLLGVLGVIALVGALNIVLLLSLLRRPASARHWWETLNPIAAAVLLSGLELGALSLLRYALFGTAVLP